MTTPINNNKNNIRIIIHIRGRSKKRLPGRKNRNGSPWDGSTNTGQKKEWGWLGEGKEKTTIKNRENLLSVHTSEGRKWRHPVFISCSSGSPAGTVKNTWLQSRQRQHFITYAKCNLHAAKITSCQGTQALLTKPVSTSTKTGFNVNKNQFQVNKNRFQRQHNRFRTRIYF